MMDDEPERMDPRCDAGGRGYMLWMEYCNDGEYIRATDYDALAAKLAAAERRERQLLDTTATCRMLRREFNTLKAKLAEVEAERLGCKTISEYLTELVRDEYERENEHG